MKRKQILILCVVLLTLLYAVILWRCCNKQATIAYYNPYTGVSFEEELTAEEAEIVVGVFRQCTYRDIALFYEASCGFSNRIYIRVNGIKYYPALDGCNRMLIGSGLQYIGISREHRDYLDQLFASHGGTFPCV